MHEDHHAEAEPQFLKVKQVFVFYLSQAAGLIRRLGYAWPYWMIGTHGGDPGATREERRA